MMSMAGQLLKPSSAFSPQTMADQPDYSESTSWLSLPPRKDETDLVPFGLEPSNNDGTASVDVFYIHGTGYLANTSWTSPLAVNSATADNARFSLANQASIFNGCCNIYAPHYREASIFAYIALDTPERDQLLDAVFDDVLKAFEYYLKNYNEGRPFVLVSHSQGTHHAMRLLELLDTQGDIAQQLVVAYMLGSGPVSLTQRYVDSLNHFDTCSSATDINCLVHWNTYGPDGTRKLFASPEPSLCVNPLSWTTQETRVSAEKHLGAAAISGAYTMKMAGDEVSDSVRFEQVAAPMPQYTWAQCRDSFLYIQDQTGKDYEKLGKSPDKFYHGIDFSVFHMNIRDNVGVRISEYMQ